MRCIRMAAGILGCVSKVLTTRGPLRIQFRTKNWFNLRICGTILVSPVPDIVDIFYFIGFWNIYGDDKNFCRWGRRIKFPQLISTSWRLLFDGGYDWGAGLMETFKPKCYLWAENVFIPWPGVVLQNGINYGRFVEGVNSIKWARPYLVSDQFCLIILM